MRRDQVACNQEPQFRLDVGTRLAEFLVFEVVGIDLDRLAHLSLVSHCRGSFNPLLGAFVMDGCSRPSSCSDVAVVAQLRQQPPDGTACNLGRSR